MRRKSFREELKTLLTREVPKQCILGSSSASFLREIKRPNALRHDLYKEICELASRHVDTLPDPASVKRELLRQIDRTLVFRRGQAWLKTDPRLAPPPSTEDLLFDLSADQIRRPVFTILHGGP